MSKELYYKVCKDKELCDCVGCPLMVDGKKMCYYLTVEESVKFVIDSVKNSEVRI